MKKIVSALLVVALSAAVANAQMTDVVDGQIVINGGLTEISGINFDSPGGFLETTTAEDEPPEPWAFQLSGSPTNVAFGVVPGTVDLPDPWESTVNYTGDAPADDLAVSYGSAGGSVTVPVVPEPATGLLTAFGALGLLGFRRRR